MMSRCLLLWIFIIAVVMLWAEPTPTEMALTKGIQCLQSGNYDTAKTSLEPILDTEQRAVEPLLQVYFETGAYQEGLALAQKLSQHPNDALRGWIWVGKINMELGRYEDAKVAYQNAQNKKNDCIPALFGLGYHALLTGAKEQFLKYWGEVFDNYDPNNNYSSEDLTYIAKSCRLYVMNCNEADRTDTLKTIVQEMLPEAIRKDKYNYAAYQEMAEIFLEAYNEIDAKTAIEEVLQLNPHHPNMLQCQAIYFINKGDQPKAVEVLDHALKINPKLVPAFGLKAQLCLADEEYAQAQEYLNQSLSVNPNDLVILSLQAALYAMQGYETRYQTQCQKILSMNPTYGELYFIVANMMGHKRQFNMVVDLNRKAIALNPYLWNSYIELGMSLMHLGQIEEAKKCFDKVQEEYNFHTQTHNMLLLLKKYQEFKLYRDKNFTVRVHISEAEIMQPLVDDVLKQAFTTLQQKYHFTPELPILFEMFPSHDDFSVRTIGLDSLGASGACFGKVVVAVSPKSRKLGDFNWASVAWHELAHVFTLQLSNYQVPRWFTEGLSEFTEYERNPGCQRKHDHHLYSVYSAGKMRNMARFNAGFTRPEYPMEISVCYYQAGLICQYIQERYGADSLVKMLKLYGQGKKDAEVFEIVFNQKLEEFDKDFVAWLNKNTFSKLKVFPTIALDELLNLRDLVEEQPTQDNYLKLALGYLQNHRLSDAEIYAEQILNNRPSDANKIIAYDILGQVAFQKGNQTKAQTMLETAASLGSENFDTHLMLGILYFNQKQLDKAKTELEKAKQAYPNYVEGNNPYLLLAKIYQLQKQNDKRLAELNAYMKLNAHDFKLRLELAKEFYQTKDYARTILLLKEGLDIYPLSIEAYQLLASSYKETQQWKPAQQSYRALLALQPEKNQEIFFTELGEVCIQLQDWHGAKEALGKALQVKPGYTPAKRLLDQIMSNPNANIGPKPVPILETPASLEIKISETQDPTPIHQEFVYITYITNISPDTIRNIKITAQASSNLQVVSVRSPVSRQLDNNQATFATISELASSKKIKILIACRPKQAGTGEVQFNVSYEGLANPIEVKETTQIK